MKNLICAVTVLAVSTVQADTIYVDVDCPGPGNGSEADPYCSIQTAIDNAVDTDEIVVAPGTYFETIDFDGKAITLRSSDGAEVTIIDGTGFFHVVQCVTGEGPDTVFDGFTVTGGNANGSFPDNRGGGMSNDGSCPTVINCVFVGNFAGFGGGGGMVNGGSSPTVINCTFSQNDAPVGGGMANVSNSSPAVTNCTFSGNSANRGGGMYNDEGIPTVTGCTFSGNGAVWGGGMFNSFSFTAVMNCTFSDNSAEVGGGMFNDGGSPTVTNCTFCGNSSVEGGGMANGGSSATVTNCTFDGNTTAGGGGGMVNGGSSVTVANCTFSGNSSGGGFGGGGMANGGGSPTVTNCAFSHNSAVTGGGMVNGFNSSPTVTNCTFSQNSAVAGGGMGNYSPTSPTVTNCVLWGDTPNEIFGPATVTYSDVRGGLPGTGNIDADPLFVDPDNGDFRLSAGSPCIDAGDNTAVPKFVLRDLDGNPRFVADVCAGAGGATVDMGAYEFQGTSCDLGTMMAMLAAWGSCDECSRCRWDFDGDCSVGILDMLILLWSWG